ncbi:hypothetical protein EDB84DRAFT_1442781 [Lactarius hengduanensis]|nr:hypothetical protein EDB84DRAFT_1442781 [Lactarius hengduanensis]
MLMWSWSVIVIGGACDSGLPAAAAAIVVVMLGVAGSSELNSGEVSSEGPEKATQLGVGSASAPCPVLSSSLTPHQKMGLGHGFPQSSLPPPSSSKPSSAPRICVNAVSCRSSVRGFTRSRGTVHASSTQPRSVACKLSGVHTISASKSGSVAWSWSLIPSPYEDCPCGAQTQHSWYSGGAVEVAAAVAVEMARMREGRWPLPSRTD